MATITKRNGRWQARVRRKGFPTHTKTFANKTSAERWVRHTEVQIETHGLAKDKPDYPSFIEAIERHFKESQILAKEVLAEMEWVKQNLKGTEKYFSLRKLKLELMHYEKDQNKLRHMVAKKLKVKPSDVENMENRFAGADKSLNSKDSEKYDQEIGNFIVDDKCLDEIDLVDRIDLVRKRSWFKKAMRELGVRESQIIALRHLSDDPLTLEKLGEILKISKERVRQIESRAIKKLKAMVKQISSQTRLGDTS